MERILLWLDELDDYVAIGFLDPGRLRRRSLQAGLAAALALILVDGGLSSGAYVSSLALLAATTVLLWAGSAAAELAGR